MAAETPGELMHMIQQRANNLTCWMLDNMMLITPSKSKLLVMATQHLRMSRAPNVDFTVDMRGKVVHTTPSERLLGVTVRQDLTWQVHYWGKTWRESGNQTGVEMYRLTTIPGASSK